jgi:hypothetical protein
MPWITPLRKLLPYLSKNFSTFRSRIIYQETQLRVTSQDKLVTYFERPYMLLVTSGWRCVPLES